MDIFLFISGLFFAVINFAFFVLWIKQYPGAKWQERPVQNRVLIVLHIMSCTLVLAMISAMTIVAYLAT